MASGASTTRRGRSGRASAPAGPETTADAGEADRADEGGDARTLLVAALVGAAIGAGIGLLASQALEEEPTMTRVVRSARRRAGRSVRRGAAAVGSAGDALGDARDAVGEFASRARSAFEDALEREVKQLRRNARRQRRRFGL
ncbi:MAG: hypothetical protein JO180_05800 [Gemmatirosa sp.]|nr:hypothetical protein [Gemmatirosa sp.]